MILLSMTQSDVFQLETNLQRALNLLHIWCQQNGMVFNTDKTKIMLITSKQKKAQLAKPWPIFKV